MKSQIAAGQTLSLPKVGSWPASAHCYSEDQALAIDIASRAERPLLVRGEPGLGKSQIGRAVAASRGWRLITATIHSRIEVDDLLYHVDHVGRMAAANLRKRDDAADKKRVNDELPIGDFIHPGPVWQALDANEDTGEDSWPEGGYKSCEQLADAQGCVLLIDEIDKAHSDIPNALLEVLNNRAFTVAPTREVITRQQPLFVVVTANDQRGLPAAFLRRCAVLDLELGDSVQKVTDNLTEIANSHIERELFSGEKVGDHVSTVAAYVAEYRARVPDSYYRPGTSEMLDMLRVLNDYDQSVSADTLKKKLDILAKFLLKKSFRE